MKNLNMDIRYLKGVGPKREKVLKKIDIETIEDLLFYFPRDYEDRRKISLFRESVVGEKYSYILEVIGQELVLRPRRNLSILKVPVSDGYTNGYLIWFNQEYLKYQFEIGKKYIVNGKFNIRAGEIQINNPDFQDIENKDKLSRIIPIYDLTKGITNRQLSNLVERAFKKYGNEIEEIVPSTIVKKYGLTDRKIAVKNLHFPQNKGLLIRSRNRMALEELIVLQTGLSMFKKINKSKRLGIPQKEEKKAKELINKLPFKLTNAQKKVFEEIKLDMRKSEPMNRLVQGDVGSGKTMVAILAMLISVDSGYQAAMMAPTEILATQHYENIKKMLSDFDINIGLLKGSLSKKEKEETLLALKDGKIDILIGTHALIQEDVKFNNLGLVITDEQHRFGVRQRELLAKKGKAPHILVMTATPIPRTLAHILYGDLDISIIDELPPGRKEIKTYALGFNMLESVKDFIRKEIESGRQAYVVCPLIEENEDLKILSVEEVYEDFKKSFPEMEIKLLHGAMKNEDKELTMESFQKGDTKILVSTTVIEVGVDVSNANTILIYNSERFGLAQLHQLRGRVGRGSHQSYCILLNGSNSKVAKERLRIMEKTNDGFIISEKDLQLRGPGEFFGTKQHGLPELKVANLFKDIEILKIAQKEAANILKEDPELEKIENKNLKEYIVSLFES